RWSSGSEREAASKLAHPRPIRPCRRRPDKYEVTMGISSGVARRRRSARSATFSRRAEVAAMRPETSTSAASCIRGGYGTPWGRCVGGSDIQEGHPMSTTTIAELRAQSRSRSALDFPGTIRSHYPYWDAPFRPYLLLALDALPAEHFGIKPRPDMLTAHQTVLHIAEAEHGWMLGVVEGRGYEEWVVEHEDPAQGWKTLYDA